MSRSYKKHPISKSHDYIYTKAMANRAVRRKSNDLPSKGKSYRKIINSWELNDYISRHTFSEFIYLHRHFGDTRSEEELYQLWSKWYKRK